MRSYIVKDNYIGSAITEILRYKHTKILLLFYRVHCCNFQHELMIQLGQIAKEELSKTFFGPNIWN